ncbi:MAG TPA: hypothetical protein VFX02_13265 [Gammaproteobacteria bacterium]|nr:hypothetical protein [Gammaproteobacteria bacterium]
MNNHEYTDESEAVIAAEREHILLGREEENVISQKDEFTGLALSGGGIRSASFCLGVIQALVNGGVLKKMDYLSTASGGGYLGSALTWFLRRGLPDGSKAGKDPENFPFGRAGCGARNQQGNRNAILDFLRQHGEYLAPGNGLDFISFIGYSLHTVFISLLVYFSLASLFMFGVISLPILFRDTPIPDIMNADGTPLVLSNVFLLAAVVFVGFFFITSIIYSLITRLPFGSYPWRYRFRAWMQVALGIYLKLAVISAVLGSLPVVYDALLALHAHIKAAGASTMLGTLMGWYSNYRDRRSQKEPGAGNSMTALIAAVLIIYGLLLGAYITADIIYNSTGLDYILPLAALIFFAVVLGYCININYVSLHRMYRDRLMEAFTPNPSNVAGNQWGLATEADEALLEDMCQPPNRRPYHILNTNLVLVNSETSKYRGRGGDCFIMSPLYCGSDATGWRQTSTYLKKSSRGISLPTAMAISGAALNPSAANNGRGSSRNRWVSILYTILNLRLGYWILNPGRKGSIFFTPNFIKPGLTQSILGKGLRENRSVLELSDGGHFDNLGLYEMIRRRLKTIIVCDGGADAKFTFDDLANAIERVRVDFGARILFNDEEFPLSAVLPDSAGSEATDTKYQLAKRGFAVASIHYADGGEGTLIYIKATMVRDLPMDVYSYKSANPSFPHQPTADQFFDEVQIEAYRELGYYLGWQVLEANTPKGLVKNKKPRWI